MDSLSVQVSGLTRLAVEHCLLLMFLSMWHLVRQALQYQNLIEWYMSVKKEILDIILTKSLRHFGRDAKESTELLEK